MAVYWTALPLFAFLIAADAAAAPWARHTIDASARGADGVRAADVNGDGLPDIATAWEEGGITRVYVHPGHGAASEPWPAVTVGQTQSPEDAVFVDADRDGAVDVVSSCEGDAKSVYVHWAPQDSGEYMNPEAWRTEALPASRGAAQWMYCLPMDADGDGDTDLVCGSKNEGAGIGVFSCPDTPRDLAAWRWQPLYAGEWIMSLELHDINGDGAMDILASDRKGPGRGALWLGRAAGGAWQVERIGAPGAAEFMFLRGGRLAPDGAFHVVTGSRDTRGIFHYARQADTGDWAEKHATAPETCGTPKGFAVGDLDGDGALEAVMSCENAFNKQGLIALDLESLSLAWDIGGLEGVKFDRIELLDLDGDGDLDVLTSEETTGLGVVWYENPR